MVSSVCRESGNKTSVELTTARVMSHHRMAEKKKRREGWLNYGRGHLIMHGGQAERQTLLPETHTAPAPRPQTLCTAHASEGPLPA